MAQFWKWYDRIARIDFAATLLAYAKWLWAIVPGGGGVTFIWAAAEERSALNVWVMTIAVMALLAVLVHFTLKILDRRRTSILAVAAPAFERPLQSQSQLLPNWPIHELFSHIDPNVLQVRNDGPDRWEIVGNRIRDALSLGQLKIWGRPTKDHASDYLETRPVVREIDATYWHSATFSFLFFDDTARSQPHTHVPPNSDLPQYTDLHVNRAQAIGIWPSPTPAPRERLGRIPLLDFMKMAERRGWRIAGEHNLEGVDLLDGLRQAGIDGSIRFWGRLNRFGNRVLIDSEACRPINQDHWHEYQFDWHSVLAANENADTSTYDFRADNRYAGGYVDILLDGDVANTWLESDAPQWRGRRNRERGKRA